MKKIYGLLSVLTSISFVHTMHFYSPLADVLLLPRTADRPLFSFTAAGGTGSSQAYVHYVHAGHTHHERTTNPFKLWSSTENTLAMLEGSEENSLINALAQTVNGKDDGIRGHMALSGTYALKYGFLYSMYVPFTPHWSVLLLLPHYHAMLNDITIQDLTRTHGAEDKRVQELLTGTIDSILTTYGAGLRTASWSHTGLGDLSCFIQWEQSFIQHKPFLKEVELHTRCGIQFPTARHNDLSCMLKHSFGNNGAWALPFGARLSLHLGEYLLFGIDGQLTYTIGHAEMARVKTNRAQSEHFLLHKRKMHKEFGMEQCFTLFCTGMLPRGLTITTAYQYFKHGDDAFSAHSTLVNSTLANTARSLHETTAHHIIIKGEWDMQESMQRYNLPHIVLNCFAKIPFNGKNCLLTSLVGATIAIQY